MDLKAAKALLTKSRRSLKAAEKAHDPDYACRHAFAAALGAARAIGGVTGQTVDGTTLEKVIAGLDRDELIPAARALDSCALFGAAKNRGFPPGRLSWDQGEPVFEPRSGMYSQELGTMAAFAARQILTRAEEIVSRS